MSAHYLWVASRKHTRMKKQKREEEEEDEEGEEGEESIFERMVTCLLA